MGQPWYIVGKNAQGIAAPKIQVKKNAKSLATSVPAFFKVATSASDDLLASAGASAHVDFAQTCVLEAELLNAGTLIRINGQVAVTNASGTDTLEVRVYLGSTVLITTTAVDPGSTTDIINFDMQLAVRANAGATASIAGRGSWTSLLTGGPTTASSIVTLAPTNFATNGALTVKVSAKWSATTASTSCNLRHFTVEVAP